MVFCLLYYQCKTCHQQINSTVYKILISLNFFCFLGNNKQTGPNQTKQAPTENFLKKLSSPSLKRREIQAGKVVAIHALQLVGLD